MNNTEFTVYFPTTWTTRQIMDWDRQHPWVDWWQAPYPHYTIYIQPS